MELRERRIVSRLIRFGLVGLAIVIAGGWFMAKRGRPSTSHIRVEGAAPVAVTLAPGDIQIFNEDGTVDVILAGNRLSAGLSPAKLAEVRAKIAQSTAKDTSGLGGSIATLVKETVADKIGIRAVYPLAEMRDLRYDDGRILIEWRDGKESALLGDGKIRVDDEDVARRFRREDAERLIAAVKARLR
ncbi:MAG TPA: hypothetical protein VFO66_10120 [Gemmatimonadaceae bacterium]|nr:hypothetical protein [Gemmatimonadaceae bacterium]